VASFIEAMHRLKTIISIILNI